jgi:hypothetical protein
MEDCGEKCPTISMCRISPSLFADPDELKAWALRAEVRAGNEPAELSS